MAVISVHLRRVSDQRRWTIGTWLISPRRPPLVLEAWNHIAGIEEVDGWYSIKRLGWRRYNENGPVGTWR